MPDVEPVLREFLLALLPFLVVLLSAVSVVVLALSAVLPDGLALLEALDGKLTLAPF